jgi:hypothetical protein
VPCRPHFSILEPETKCNHIRTAAFFVILKVFLIFTALHVLLRLCSAVQFGNQMIQVLPEGRNVITAPTMADAQPPTSSHKVLFVGDPVKARETPELNESEALNPIQIKMIPTTNRAIPIPFCITILSFAAGHSKFQACFVIYCNLRIDLAFFKTELSISRLEIK